MPSPARFARAPMAMVTWGWPEAHVIADRRRRLGEDALGRIPKLHEYFRGGDLEAFAGADVEGHASHRHESTYRRSAAKVAM